MDKVELILIDLGVERIEALEAENAALRAMNADVDVGINNWIDHIEKHGASGAAIQAMRNPLERAKPVAIGKVIDGGGV
jgi:hypothetical protein